MLIQYGSGYDFGFADTELIHALREVGACMRAFVGGWVWDPIPQDKARSRNEDILPLSSNYPHISPRRASCCSNTQDAAARALLDIPGYHDNWMAWHGGTSMDSVGWKRVHHDLV